MLKIGKLDNDLLEQIVFKKITFRRPEVLTRPGIGEDCAVVDFGTYECVMSTDPITAAVGDIGRLAIHISCNDIASNGVEPLGIMLTVMLPEGTEPQDIEKIMEQAAEASEELGVEIIGGHTEITSAVIKPIVVSTAIGRGENGHQKPGSHAAGRFYFVTKAAGLEGTAIIARDYEEELKELLPREELDYAKGLMKKVSVVKEGIIAGKSALQVCMTLRKAVFWALYGNVPSRQCWCGSLGGCHSSGRGYKKICEQYDVDYLRLISSGSMVIMAGPEKKDSLLQALSEAGVQASCIGMIKPPERNQNGSCRRTDGNRTACGRRIIQSRRLTKPVGKHIMNQRQLPFDGSARCGMGPAQWDSANLVRSGRKQQ